MTFSFIQELFAGSFASAICWTLIHSLWQGLFFALATGLILLATKKAKPSLRYNFLSLQFVLFLVAVVITFIREWNNAGPGNGMYGNITGGTAAAEAAHATIAIYAPDNFRLLNGLSAFLSNHASTLVAIWFMIFLVKSIKIISSLFYLQRLRSYKVHQPPVYWKSRLTELCAQLRVGRPVQLLESEILKVPAVFGHLKPVIFIPLGILSGMPAEQVEAVLLHELAHIRRRDYLFNLVQNIVETVFFFNPALLWVSSILRDERENCCDDIAIAQINNKKQFIESLIRFRELCIHNHSRYVTAFPGRRNSFVNRITRIAMNKNKSLNPAENIFLAISLVIIGTLVMAFSQVKESPATVGAAVNNTPPAVITGSEIVTPAEPARTVTPQAKDTVPVRKAAQAESIRALDNGDYSIIYSDIDKAANKETVVLKTAGNEYRIVKMNGTLAYLMVNDEKIPQDKLGDYSELLKKINAQLERMKKEQALRDKEQEQRDAEQEVRNKEQDQRNAEQAVRNKEQEQRDAEQVMRNKQQEQQNAEQALRDKEQETRNAEQVARDKEQEQRNAEQAVRNKEQEQRNAEQEVRNKEQAARDEAIEKLRIDLIGDNIIKDKKDLSSFTLTDDEFTVNGIKQSPVVFNKYKTKYRTLLGGKFNFRY